MRFKAPKGTKDIIGNEAVQWQYIEAVIREVCAAFGVNEIRTPIFEQTELFHRSVGESTDIVQKEMFTFEDKGNRSMTLRPEGTAPAARAYIENSLYGAPQPIKLYYINPTFRYEEPQAGRQRQFHQFGVECFGAGDEAADAEVIALAGQLITQLGLHNISLRINSLGCPNCRPAYIKALKLFIQNHHDALCKSCQVRAQTNPLRVLDCKEPGCSAIIKEAPSCLDYLDEACRAHFESLGRILDAMGIAYIIDPSIVRGLDYYTRTVFEFISDDIGAQSTVCGGGRYDNLLAECGGPQTPAVGFAMGLERLLLVLQAQNLVQDIPIRKTQRFIGYVGDKGKLAAQVLVHAIRCSGQSAETDIVGRSVKAQMKYANKIGAKEVVIIGDDEIAGDLIAVKDMDSGESLKMRLSEYQGQFEKPKP